MKIIEFNNVSKEFNDGDIKVKALKDINLELYEGEFVAIVGPSGCGKSTLLNLITNLYKPTKGDIYFKGVNLVNINHKNWYYILQNEIGFIYQYYELIDCLDINDNINLKKNCLDKIVNELLDKLDISLFKYQKVKYLSGGQRQRVGIVRALTNSPSLILADEPTGALDQENSKILLNILKENSKNSLVIMVTHNEELALQYVSKIIYMDHGEIISIKQINNSNKEKVISKDKTYKQLSNKLGLKYLFASLKTLKVRLFFLITSGSFIFLFISLLFCALSSASNYICEIYMNTPLYSVFNLCTYEEINSELVERNINQEVLAKLIHKYKDTVFRENIDPLLNQNIYQNVSYNNKILNNVKVYSLPFINEQCYLLKGRPIKSEHEIIVNESFLSLMNDKNVIGKYVDVKEKFVYKGKEYINNYKKEIVGISKDSLFNQSSEIYVSYDEHINYLKNNNLGDNITLFDAFYTFDYQVVVNSYNVDKVINNMKNDPYYRSKNNVPGHSYHFSFKENIAYEEKEMFDELIRVISLLVYFFIFLGLIVFTIFTSYVLSSFVLEKKKDYAIFSQLGIRNIDIYLLIIKESLLISITMIILGVIFLSIFYLILSKIIIYKIIISYIPLILLIFLYLLQCLISSLLPIIQLRKMEIGNILKSE